MNLSSKTRQRGVALDYYYLRDIITQGTNKCKPRKEFKKSRLGFWNSKTPLTRDIYSFSPSFDKSGAYLGTLLNNQC